VRREHAARLVDDGDALRPLRDEPRGELLRCVHRLDEAVHHEVAHRPAAVAAVDGDHEDVVGAIDLGVGGDRHQRARGLVGPRHRAHVSAPRRTRPDRGRRRQPRIRRARRRRMHDEHEHCRRACRRSLWRGSVTFASEPGGRRRPGLRCAAGGRPRPGRRCPARSCRGRPEDARGTRRPARWAAHDAPCVVLPAPRSQAV
jgi:hypothetical protein